MSQAQIRSYGSWSSPITADLIVSTAIGLGGPLARGSDLYWLESRPLEGGRTVLVHRDSDGRSRDLTLPPWNVRSRVHEYGGGSFTVYDGTVYFVHFSDQRLYRLSADGEPEPLTPEGYRWADLRVHPAGRQLVAVREEHGEDAVHNCLVRIDLETGEQTVLATGADFYASPRFSPDGTRLAFLSWNFPNMPWDGTDLWVLDLSGEKSDPRHVAGGPDESIFQPEWSPAGVLHFVSDRTGWWNLFREAGEQPLVAMEAEFGLPQWVFGQSTYAFLPDGAILCTYRSNGLVFLARLEPASQVCTPVPLPYTDISGPSVGAEAAFFIAASASEPAALVRLDLASGSLSVVCRSTEQKIDPEYLSTPEPVVFATTGGRSAYGFYYPPCNRDFAGPVSEKPPLLVRSHGGPTGATSSAYNLRIQFWTSRGFAVLDVNYGGSTGYGRAYRRSLDANWGIVDVDDCVQGALALVERELADGRRLAIEGGSAGGYTTLAALAFRDTFAAGASYYGVSDLEALARDTHKFESRYLDRLVGPYPERRDLYIERSPIHHVDRLDCPVIFFQGLEDRVVPPNQAEMMVDALARKGLPVAYVPFALEQHGFRRAENIKRALEAQLYFFGRVFDFVPADAIEPVPVTNLDG